jgi:hypothetical protein
MMTNLLHHLSQLTHHFHHLHHSTTAANLFTTVARVMPQLHSRNIGNTPQSSSSVFGICEYHITTEGNLDQSDRGGIEERIFRIQLMQEVELKLPVKCCHTHKPRKEYRH